jgi:hypothetical protein
MTRFSISLSDDEMDMLERIRVWYEAKTGVRVSRCSIIKRLLFETSHENGLFADSV